MQSCILINWHSHEISNIRCNTYTLGNRTCTPIQTDMKHYIIYTIIGMAMIEMATGDLDRMSRGVEMKFARIEKPVSLLS